jgi:hypothetical protein
MEVHRTPTSVSRFLLEVFFSIHIGYAGVSMVFCAIPSASIPFAHLEVYLTADCCAHRRVLSEMAICTKPLARRTLPRARDSQ